MERRTGEWGLSELLAGLVQERARLTGDYEDYARAESLLSASFAQAPPGTGPFLARAGLHLSLHRLDQAEADLVSKRQVAVLLPRDRERIESLEADLQLQRGLYRDAVTHFEEQLARTRDYSNLARVAQGRASLGEFEIADSMLAEAERSYHGLRTWPRAWLQLSRGLLDLEQGDPRSALAHYEIANQILPGWWLVEEHIAEAWVLLGRSTEAEALYLSIVERTGHPEFMDALAEIAETRGDEKEAAAWDARAETAFHRQLELFPEAASGHALDHYLERSADSERAIQLAEANARLRPNGEALLQLARAYRLAGRSEESSAMLSRAIATGWVSERLVEESKEQRAIHS